MVRADGRLSDNRLGVLHSGSLFGVLNPSKIVSLPGGFLGSGNGTSTMLVLHPPSSPLLHFPLSDQRQLREADLPRAFDCDNARAAHLLFARANGGRSQGTGTRPAVREVI
jgi:hypothetical protein